MEYEKPVKRVIWSDEETEILLIISRNENIEQLVASDRYRSINFYNMIADKLLESGYKRTGEQIRTKLKALRKDYKQMEKQRTENSYADNNEHFYQLLESVFSASESKPKISKVMETEQIVSVQAKRVIWLDNETAQMLYIVRDENILQLLASKKYRKINIFKKVSDKMQDFGYDRVPEQIKTKLKALRKEYDWLKSQTTTLEDVDLNELCCYFDILDEIFGKPIEPIIPKIEPKVKLKKFWSNEETDLMLSIVCEESILDLLYSNRYTTQNMVVYRQIAAKMWNCGFYIGAERIRTKLLKLRKEYAKIKKNYLLDNDEKIDKMGHYETLDHIFGRYYIDHEEEEEESIVSSDEDSVFDDFLTPQTLILSHDSPPPPESPPLESPSKPSRLLAKSSSASVSKPPTTPPSKKIKLMNQTNPELEELEIIEEKLMKKNHDWWEEQMEKQRQHEHEENIRFHNEMTKIFDSFLTNLNEINSQTSDHHSKTAATQSNHLSPKTKDSTSGRYIIYK